MNKATKVALALMVKTGQLEFAKALMLATVERGVARWESIPIGTLEEAERLFGGESLADGLAHDIGGRGDGLLDGAGGEDGFGERAEAHGAKD